MHATASRPVRAGVFATAAALAALTFGASPALAAKKTFSTNMFGVNEPSGKANFKATGAARVTVDDETDKVCYALNVKGLVSVTGAHIHKAPKGKDGPVVVPLEAPKAGSAVSCADVSHDLAEALLANPHGYYVNVHTAKFPAGAIRGQL